MRNHTQQIKEKIDIVELIGTYVKLEKSGINYRARCPFHNEKTPSFFVSPTRQSFYCFGCGEKGDIFSFVEKFEGLDFPSTLKKLAEQSGVDIGDYSEEKKDKKITDNLFSVVEEAKELYEKYIESDNKVLEYLKERGLKKETIKKWGIGATRQGWRNLYDYMISRNYSQEILLKAGLIKEKNSKYYDTFRDRIVFPIADTDGRTVAFSGRQFGPTDKEGPKYLNSPETEIFKKSKVLYGWHFARNSIRKMNYAVLVEGQFDLVLAHQSGTENTLATSGTALTVEHLKLIKRLTNRIIIAYDADKAGEAAALRATQLALSLGIDVKIAPIPENEDPASLINKDSEIWKNALRTSEHFIDFLLDRAIKQQSGIKLVKEVEKNILPYLLWLNSSIERSHFVKRIADKIGISEQAISTDLSKIDRGIYNDLERRGEGRVQNIEKNAILAGIIFSQDDTSIEERLLSILGKERATSLLAQYEVNKEKVTFQSEDYVRNSNLSAQEVGSELLDRIELEELKKQLKELAHKMDGEKTHLPNKKLEDIYERIKQLQTRN